ncbi:diguanylate cyclase [Tistrella mobilis]|uniref:diguanylate cyclase n=1 Tax=Tistrella mobilis TaxID=171437 RepID=UPI003557DCAC
MTKQVNRTAEDHPDIQTMRLRELHRVLVTAHAAPDAAYADFIDTGRHILGMEIGLISRIADNRFHVLAISGGEATGIRPGDIFPLSDTYCAEVIASASSVTLNRVGLDRVMCLHPVYRRFGLESYIAAPVWVKERIYGTLAFMDARPRPEGFGSGEVEFLEMMATALGRVVERDLAERDRLLAEKRLDTAARLFGTAFDQAPIGMALVAPDGRFLKVNRALCRICGYDETKLLAIDFQQITDPDHLQSDLALLQAVLRGERTDYRIEKRYIRKDGRRVWVELSVSLVRDDDGAPLYFVSQIQDIDDKKALLAELERRQIEVEQANHRLERLAATDPLTGLANRRAFMAQFENALDRHAATGRSLCLLLIDIDHFKAFNDRFGHPAGDAALSRVAAAMTGSLGENGIVARHGGEEFAVLLPETDPEAGYALAERLRCDIARLRDLPAPVTISIGLGPCPPGSGQDDIARAELIALADRALYAAKAAGRNRVVTARR